LFRLRFTLVHRLLSFAVTLALALTLCYKLSNPYQYTFIVLGHLTTKQGFTCLRTVGIMVSM